MLEEKSINKQTDVGIPMIEVPKTTEAKKLCPFINDPKEHCYIVMMDSLKVESAIYYCGGHFEECEIYVKEMIK